MKIGCVLMAAGLGARFGENKLLYPIDGHSMLDRTLQAVPASLFARAVAVVSDDEAGRTAKTHGYTVLRNPAPERGQGSTIVQGIKAMDGLDAAMFCVADQPYLQQETVSRMLAAYEAGSILSLAFAGKRGNPVIFPKACFAALAAIAPDETGRVVIRANPQRLKLFEASCARELFDIDTKSDLSSR